MLRSNLARQSAASLLCVLVVQASGIPYLSVAAVAATPPKLVLLPMGRGAGAPERAEARFIELLAGELKGRTGEVALVASTVGPPVAPQARAVPAEALAALDQGQQLLSDLKFDAAAQSLRAGIDQLTAAPESIDAQRLIDGWVSLAVALFRMGDEDGASAALLNVVRFDPKYRLPDGRYPPIFVREFEKARRRAEKLAKGTLSIEAPAGSTAFVDGEDLGMVPVLQDGLLAGPHYVKVVGTQGELFGQSVEVKRGVTRVKATFAGAAAGTAARLSTVGPVLDQGAVTAAAAACRATGADFALAGVIYRTGEHQLTAATALFSAKRNAFTVLGRYTVDEELLTANVEAFKLADEISDAVADFPRPVGLPHDLLKGAAGFKSTAATGAPREVEVAPASVQPRSAIAPVAERPKLVPEPSPESAKVEPLQGLHFPGDDAPGPTVEVDAGPAWWVWALVGAGVAAAAGGTYYGVSQATRPVTGTVSAKW